MPRGYQYDPALRVAARRMRGEGMTFQAITDALGVGKSTVANWIYDPDGSKKRARIDSYAGSCRDCGKPTDGSNGPHHAPERCLGCATELLKSASAKWMIESIQRWADEHGGVPPRSTDWNVAQRLERGELRAAEEYRAGDWPATSGLPAKFGSWNAAIEAAGFEPREVGTYGRPGEDNDLCREIRTRHEAGESALQLARVYGCSPRTISYRIRKVGGSPRSPAEARALRRAA